VKLPALTGGACAVCSGQTGILLTEALTEVMKYGSSGRVFLIAEITQWIMESMRAHGQLSVFIGVMIEQIIVPVPSPLIIMGAGAVLIASELSIPNAFVQILWIIVLPGTIASTLGSFIGYFISYYGGRHWWFGSNVPWVSIGIR